MTDWKDFLDSVITTTYPLRSLNELMDRIKVMNTTYETKFEVLIDALYDMQQGIVCRSGSQAVFPIARFFDGCCYSSDHSCACFLDIVTCAWIPDLLICGSQTAVYNCSKCVSRKADQYDVAWRTLYTTEAEMRKRMLEANDNYRKHKRIIVKTIEDHFKQYDLIMEQNLAAFQDKTSYMAKMIDKHCEPPMLQLME